MCLRPITASAPPPGQPLTTRNRKNLLVRVLQEIEEAKGEHQRLRIAISTSSDRDESAHPWGTHPDSGSDEMARTSSIVGESQLARTLEKLKAAKQMLADPKFTGLCTCSCKCGRYVGIDRMMSAIGAVDISRCTQCADGGCHRTQ